MKLYHGSPEECFVPRFGLGSDEHDYGRDFYTTAVAELAREWAAGTRNADDGWRNALGLEFFNHNTVSILVGKGNHMIDAEKERVLAVEYRGKYDECDRVAREKMNRIAYDVELNSIVRTFSTLLAEAT